MSLELWWANRPPPTELWRLILRDEWHGVVALSIVAVVASASAWVLLRLLRSLLRPPSPSTPRRPALRKATLSSIDARVAPAAASSTQPLNRQQRRVHSTMHSTIERTLSSRDPGVVVAHNGQAQVAESDVCMRFAVNKVESWMQGTNGQASVVNGETLAKPDRHTVRRRRAWHGPSQEAEAGVRARADDDDAIRGRPAVGAAPQGSFSGLSALPDAGTPVSRSRQRGTLAPNSRLRSALTPSSGSLFYSHVVRQLEKQVLPVCHPSRKQPGGLELPECSSDVIDADEPDRYHAVDRLILHLESQAACAQELDSDSESFRDVCTDRTAAHRHRVHLHCI